MLISFSHRFIFVHVQRTGGSSVIRTLEPYGYRAPVTPISKLLSRTGFIKDPKKIVFRTHETARRVRELLPAGMYEDFLTIAFVRNPWSWLVSLYEVFRKGPRHRHHKIVSKMKDFREYIDWEAARNSRFQYPLITDSGGEIIIDYLGRYERLQDDYAGLCKRLDIDVAPLPRENRRTFRDYREYYDDDTREKVAEYWRRDIDLLGYDFEGLK